MSRRLARLRGIGGVAGAQLRHHRLRAALAVLGIALAVVLVIALAGLGYGLVTTGDEAIRWLQRDLWVSAGPVSLAPGSVGGVENPLGDAHATTRTLAARGDVRDAQALAFQSVYVSPDPEGFDTVVGVGIGGNASAINVVRGRGLGATDPHYANGTYDGPMTREIVVDERTAARYDLSVGDTLHVGGTLAQARENEFTVVGVTPALSRFLGVPTVGMHLSELQEISGTTGTDRASIIALRLEPGADPERVARAIERRHPALDVRTDDEQVRAIIGRQATVIAGAATLVGLAVVVGVVLAVNVLSLLVYQQRAQLAALKAAGVSGRTLVGVVFGQGAALGAAGGLLGLAATPLVVLVVNRIVAGVTGFPDLIETPAWLLAAGAGLAVVMGVAGAVVAGWRVARLSPLAHLR